MAKESEATVGTQVAPKDFTVDYAAATEKLLSQEGVNIVKDAEIYGISLSRRQGDDFISVNIKTDKKCRQYRGIVDPNTNERVFVDSIVNSAQISMITFVNFLNNHKNPNVRDIGKVFERAVSLAKSEQDKTKLDDFIMRFKDTQAAVKINKLLSGCVIDIAQVPVVQGQMYTHPFSSINEVTEVKNNSWFSYVYNMRLPEKLAERMESDKYSALDM